MTSSGILFSRSNLLTSCVVKLSILLLVTAVNFAARRIPPSNFQISLKMRKSKAAAVSVKMRKKAAAVSVKYSTGTVLYGWRNQDAHAQYFVTTKLH